MLPKLAGPPKHTQSGASYCHNTTKHAAVWHSNGLVLMKTLIAAQQARMTLTCTTFCSYWDVRSICWIEAALVLPEMHAVIRGTK